MPSTDSHSILVLWVSLSAGGALDPHHLEGGHLRVEQEMEPFAGIETLSPRGSPPPSKVVSGIKVGHAAMISITC